ncbi:AEC family transporter [Clostridium algidicarnis]|uniref:AEC family transporter n=1 Tax=Clostridium algidicarnis TaxID=37659 RepID=A0ABS6C5V6_9CLOT|nr:AEC family transporter [Clostridium algidicarnis]MBU3197332.1 AEC family transporter [Clostridium algidicarnis]MBU3220853.1 AEC family transporter [Clostridium algidicarnis]
MIILKSLQSLLTIFFLIFIGFYLSKRNWFNEDTPILFSKLVIKLSLPCFMIYNLTTSFTKEDLTSSSIGLLIPFISMILTFFLSKILALILKVPNQKRGTFSTMFFLSNTIFIGLPVNISLFGDEAIPYVLLYYIVNTFMFWTVGVHSIKKDSGLVGDKKFSYISSLKSILSPPLIAFGISVLLILFNISLPSFLLYGFKYLGNLTTPISTLFIGMTLSTLNHNDFNIGKDSLFIFMGRFIISPLVTFTIIKLFPIPELMAKVFIIESAMPVMTQIAIVSKSYNVDYKYATVMGTLSNLASLIFIPLYMLLFIYLF